MFLSLFLEQCSTVCCDPPPPQDLHDGAVECVSAIHTHTHWISSSFPCSSTNCSLPWWYFFKWIFPRTELTHHSRHEPGWWRGHVRSARAFCTDTDQLQIHAVAHSTLESWKCKVMPSPSWSFLYFLSLSLSFSVLWTQHNNNNKPTAVDSAFKRPTAVNWPEGKATSQFN